MTVTQELRLRVDDKMPDTTAIRRDLVAPVIDAARRFNPGWNSECDRLGVVHVVDELRDVINCLPDDDIMELAYIHRNCEPRVLSAEFVERLIAYNQLRKRIEVISADFEK